MGCGDRAGDPHLNRAYECCPFRGVFAGRDEGPDGEPGWDGADLGAGTTSTDATNGTFLEAGWDFVNEVDNGSEDILWILEGQNYPILWWEESN